MLLESGYSFRFPVAKRVGGTAPGWRTGSRTGRAEALPAQTAHRHCYALDVKKPHEGGRPPRFPESPNPPAVVSALIQILDHELQICQSKSAQTGCLQREMQRHLHLGHPMMTRSPSNWQAAAPPFTPACSDCNIDTSRCKYRNREIEILRQVVPPSSNHVPILPFQMAISVHRKLKYRDKLAQSYAAAQLAAETIICRRFTPLTTATTNQSTGTPERMNLGTGVRRLYSRDNRP